MRHVRATIVVVEKAKSITYSEYMTVALGIQHEERMCWIVICGPPGSTAFFHIIS